MVDAPVQPEAPLPPLCVVLHILCRIGKRAGYYRQVCPEPKGVGTPKERGPRSPGRQAGGGMALALLGGERRCRMYSILYIIGAIVVIIVLLRLLGLY